MSNFNQTIDFDIGYAPLERYPEMKYVIRGDNDQAIGVVGKDFNAVSHPEFFGKMRETWKELLPELVEDATIYNKVSRHGAWALEEVIFPKAVRTVETSLHQTDLALRFVYWHGVDGSCRNNCLVGAIDFFCTNGMVLGDYDHVKRKNTKGFSMNNFIEEITNLEGRFEEHVAWCQKIARRSVNEHKIRAMLEGIIPSERTQEKMFTSVMDEVETRGWNMWSVYSAFTEYASHENRFALRSTGNDNYEERQFKRNTDVAKWTSSPEFMALAA